MKKILSFFCLFLTAVIVSAAAPACISAETQTDMTLHTEGNQLINGNGEAVRLVGMNIPYMTWSDSSEDKVMEVLEISLNEWNANAIRLGVTPELWFGVNSENYRKTADKLIEKVAEAGKYVILDNHAFYLPDDNDIKFWSDAAVRYKDHPNVIFELFNEPAGCTWQQYYEGGHLTYTGKNDWGEDADITIDACGIPELLKAVRATGAKNVCILPGINWSFDLSCVTESDFEEFAKSVAESESPENIDGFVKEYKEKYFLKETSGNGIMYSTHPYPTKPVDWDQYLKNAALQYPILVGECGPTEKTSGFVRVLSDNDKSYLDTLTAYVDKYELNITPWAWGAWPYLNQEPSNKLSAYGSYMLEYFKKSSETKALTLYTGTDYTGESYTLEAGSYDSDSLSGKFDLSKLSSASCKSDYYQYTVTLYSEKGFKGNSYTFVPKAANVGKEICSFEPASIKIERSVPKNIIPGHASVTAPGYTENMKPENIIDGKTGTYWKNVDENPNEIVISLDKVYALNGITLAHASEASMMSVFNASDYTVSVSTDGKNFTRVIDVNGNSLGLCSYSFEQIPAAYIKVRITKGSIVENSTYYLAEVMAYGTEYNGSTDGMSISLNSYSPVSAQKSDFPVLQTVLICVFSVITAAGAVLCAVILKKRKAG